MKLRFKLPMLFFLISIIPMGVVGYLSYIKGQQILEQNTINHLVNTNKNREAELERWLNDKAADLELLASTPYFKNVYPSLMASHDFADESHMASHKTVLDHLLPLIDKDVFKGICILRADDGLVMISTDKRHEGKYLDYHPYFKEGRRHTFIQNAYYEISSQTPEMTVSTPLKDENGDVVAVLAAHLNLAELSGIMEKRNPLSRTEDTYLVNSFNFFITEPIFGKGFALKKAVHTEGVNAALAHKEGIGFYPDYRNEPVIGFYTWLKERELCLITEIDQSEAFEPIKTLGKTIGIVAVVLALFIAELGWLVAATITQPLSRLVDAAEAIGSGNLDTPIDTVKNGEIGELAISFSQMRARLKESLVSRDELVEEVKVRTLAEESLEKALVDLRRSNQDLQQFAYVASHDLQEPLRMVSSYTQLLGERYGDQLDEKAKKYIYYAVDGASRMQQLIQDLLSFSRVSTHGEDFKAVDGKIVLDQAVANLQGAVEASGAVITNDGLPVVKADPGQLALVFQNLIANAIKFVKDKFPMIHISAETKEGSCVFSIRDNGIGIDEAYKDKIFVIFQRLHTRNEYPGTGIGLSVCKKIINRHHGSIWFESRPGQGTTFYFTIPLPGKGESKI